MNDVKLLNTREAAALLGMDKSSLTRWAKKLGIQPAKIVAYGGMIPTKLWAEPDVERIREGLKAWRRRVGITTDAA